MLLGADYLLLLLLLGVYYLTGGKDSVTTTALRSRWV